jgi:hypothetical protein
MQFLVYLTVLMVSVSTVLLEVHWLTSPPPQPKPAVQAANAAKPVPKVEGPTAALSPVYPRKVEAADTMASAQSSPQQAQQPQTPQPQTQQQQTAALAQKPQAETTGAAPPSEEAKQPAVVTASVQPVASSANNACDVQACANAYRSFRASDCTYQPFDGARRVCEKAPVTRSVSRDPGGELRRASREVEVRDREDDRRVRSFRDDDDDDRDEMDDGERDVPRFFLFGGRGRRW